MSKFKLGEKALYVGSLTDCPITKRTVFSGKTQCVIIGLPGCSSIFPDGYEIEADEFDAAFVPEDELRKLLPDSDTYTKSTWADFCKVLPKQLERVT